MRNPTAVAIPTAARAREKNDVAVPQRLTRPKLAASRMAHPRAIRSYCVPLGPAGCSSIQMENAIQISASASRPPIIQPMIEHAAMTGTSSNSVC